MILTRKYLRYLVAIGKARYIGGTDTTSYVIQGGTRYVALDRLDIRRIDHYVAPTVMICAYCRNVLGRRVETRIVWKNGSQALEHFCSDTCADRRQFGLEG